MRAIIRLGDGKYYRSEVFGMYDDVQEKYENNLYYIVLNEQKSRLIKVYDWKRGTKFIDQGVIVTNMAQEGWQLDKNRYGTVSFLTKEQALDLAEGALENDALLKQCIALDAAHPDEEVVSVVNEMDAENLLCAAGGFHDGVIDSLTWKPDGSLYVVMDIGNWGGKFELHFKGDVQYNTRTRALYEDSWWFDSSIFFDKGRVWLCDIEDVNSADEIDLDYCCWFCGKSMAYRIIPN